MSLQVWLPLTGDLHNQGISNPNISLASGNTWASSGKIGNSSLTLTKLQTILPTSSCMTGAKEVSYCYWVKVNTAWSTQWLDGIRWIETDGSATSTARQEFYTNCTLVGTWYKGGSISGKAFTPGVWTHLAATFNYNTGEANFYIDGILKGTTTNIDKTYYCRGDFYIGDNGVDICQNDVRIYDHCLSAAEVHEIAQGLVLHYKLDYPGTNLLLNSAPHLNATTSWASRGGGTLSIQENSFGPYGYVIRSTYNTSSCGIHHQPYSTSTLVNGETYTFSGWARASKACKATWCNEWMTTSSTVDLTTDWQFFSHTGVIDTSRTYHSDVCYPTAVESGMWVEACMWKLEKGENASKWIPHTSDSIYKIFQDEMTHIDDSSGYGHHGTVHGAVSTKVDPRRYSSAIYLPIGNTDYIETDEGVGNPADAITMNIWFKSSNKTPGSDYHHCFNGLTTWVYIEMAVHKNGYMRSGLYINGTRYVANTDNNNILDGNWHMLTMTYDGANIRRYVDGVLKNTQAATGAINRPNDRFVFGRGTSTGYYCKEASLSDARVYATALSAADILSLYHTGAKVDNLGGFHTFQLNQEGATPKILKVGTTQHTNFIEAVQLNAANSISYKPAANTNNSCLTGILVDYSAFIDLGRPLAIQIEFDLSWSSFAAGTGGTFRIILQGQNRKIADNAFAWEGTNYSTQNIILTDTIKASASGTAHISKTNLIPASWFGTYNASYFGIRTDYSNGNGTITLSNIKITPSACAKITSNEIYASNFIEL